LNASEVVAARAMAPSYAYIGMCQRRVAQPHHRRGCVTNDGLELSARWKTAARSVAHPVRAAGRNGATSTDRPVTNVMPRKI
jgi:hypothetical protein